MRNKKNILIAASAFALAALCICCAAIGSASLAPKGVFQSLVSKCIGGASPLPENQTMILYTIRLPRIFLAVIAGGALSVSGLTLQGIFRNSLADPYILGISSGASFGAALAIVTGFGSFLGKFAITGSAFLFSIISLLFVLFIGQKTSHSRLLLAGVAIGQIFAAALSLLMVFFAQQMDKIIYWTMGSLQGNSMDVILFTGTFTVLCFAILYFHFSPMNLLLLGEDTAESMGVETKKVKGILLLTASLLTAVIVSFTGTIGFIGLIVPHVARLVIGPDHKYLYPLSFLWGAGFLCLADTLARSAFSPLELPIGIVTALIGAPFFLWLLFRSRERSNL